MSRRKADKSAASGQPPASAVPSEPITPPDPDVVDGKISLKDWEKVLDQDEGSALAAIYTRSAVEEIAEQKYDEYLGREAVAYCVEQVRHSLNHILKWSTISLDRQENLGQRPEAGDEPILPPRDDLFHRVPKEVTAEEMELAVSHQPQAKAAERKAMKRLAMEAEIAAHLPPDDPIGVFNYSLQTLQALRRESLIKPDATEEELAAKLPQATFDYLDRVAKREKQGQPLTDDNVTKFLSRPKYDGAIPKANRLPTGSTFSKSETMALMEGRMDAKKKLPDRKQVQPSAVVPAQLTHEQQKLKTRVDALGKQLKSDRRVVYEATAAHLPPPPLPKQADFTAMYRRVQREAAERRLHTLPPGHQRVAAARQYSEQQQQTGQFTIAQLSGQTTQRTVAGVPLHATGLTAAQRHALGLDEQGRARVRQIPMAGRVQRSLANSDAKTAS